MSAWLWYRRQCFGYFTGFETRLADWKTYALTEGHAGPHRIQGIGANFVPGNLDKNVIDQFLDIEDDAALKACSGGSFVRKVCSLHFTGAAISPLQGFADLR